MTTKDTKLAAVGLALMLLSVVSLASPAFGAAPAIDTETNTTATTTALNAGNTVQNFDANASQNISTLQASFDSQNPKVRVLDPDRGNATVAAFTAADMVQTGSASGLYYYNLTMDEGDLRYDEINAGEVDTAYIQLVNNTGAANPALTNFSIKLNETGGRTVRVLSSSASGLSAFTGLEVAGMSLPVPFVSSSHAKYTATSLPTAENGTVVLHAQNATLTDQLGAFSSYASGTPITGMAVMVDGSAVPVYMGSAPSSASGTYAVADLDRNDVRIKGLNGTSADITVSTTGIAPWTAVQLYGLDALNPLSIGGSAVGMGLFLFGTLGRRREQEG